MSCQRLFPASLAVILSLFFWTCGIAQNTPPCLPDLLVLQMTGAGSGQKFGNPALSEQMTYQASGSFDIIARNPVLTTDGFWFWDIDSLHGTFHFIGDASRISGNFTQTAHWDTEVEITVSGLSGWVKYNPATGKIDSLRSTWDYLADASTSLDGIRWSAQGGGRFVPYVNLPSGWSNLEGLFPVPGALNIPMDTEPPVAVCQDHTVYLDSGGNAQIAAADVGSQSTDNCAITDMWVVPSLFDCSDIGIGKEVYLSVTDAAGNSSSCEAFVQVLDNTPPEVACPDFTVELDANGMAGLNASNVPVTGTDACGAVSFYSAEPNTFSCADVGQKGVSIWVADPSFNFTHCSTLVTVKSPDALELELTTHNRFFKPKSLIKVKSGDDLSDKFAKICADGSLRTSQIALRGCFDLEKLKCRVKEDPEEKNTGVFGRFTLEQTAGTDERIFWYEHPECWEDPGSNTNVSFKQLHFEVINSEDGSVVMELPVRLFRSPVMMVHGVWANGAGAFGSMQTGLSQGQNQLPAFYPGPLTKVVDYKCANAASFYENRDVVLTSLRNYLFELTWQAGFSASRVSVVGHSMGGLLTRMFLQSNDYKNDLIKLITINTPHSGTQTANWLMSHYGPVRNFFDKSGRPTYKGAVRDLQMNSDALWGFEGLNSPWQLNWNTVPSHAIVTFASQPETDIVAYILLGIIGLESNGKPAFDFLTEDVFNNQFHDLIVPLNSQTGGLHAPQVSVFDQQWHSSTGNSQVINRVKELLEKCPDAPEFSQEGFDPEKLEYNYTLPGNAPEGNGTVHITWPPDGSVFAPGEFIGVETVGAGNIAQTAFTAGSDDLALFFGFQPTSSAIFNYAIPPDALGKIFLKSFGIGPNGAFAFDSISINVQSDAVLTGFKTSLKDVYVPVGGLASITAQGSFSDSIERIVTHQPGVAFIMDNPNVAQVVAQGLIKGLVPDTSRLFVSWNGFADTVEVIVLPGTPPVSAAPEAPGDQSADTTQLSGYWIKNTPNPFSDATTITYGLAKAATVELEITHLAGKKVAHFTIGKKTAGEHQFVWMPEKSLSQGVYVVRIWADGQLACTKKMAFIL